MGLLPVYSHSIGYRFGWLAGRKNEEKTNQFGSVIVIRIDIEPLIGTYYERFYILTADNLKCYVGACQRLAIYPFGYG